ncbi:hypothetical protein AAC387_Pa02g1746 [Persea americana]
MGIEKNTPVSTPASIMVSHGEKPENFNRTEFKRWQQKMLFYLTTLNLARLRIEEDNLASKKKAGKSLTEAKANVMEYGHNPKKRKNCSSGPKQGPNDNKKFKGKCYVCDKRGHCAKDYRERNDQNNTSKKPA